MYNVNIYIVKMKNIFGRSKEYQVISDLDLESVKRYFQGVELKVVETIITVEHTNRYSNRKLECINLILGRSRF